MLFVSRQLQNTLLITQVTDIINVPILTSIAMLCCWLLRRSSHEQNALLKGALIIVSEPQWDWPWLCSSLRLQTVLRRVFKCAKTFRLSLIHGFKTQLLSSVNFNLLTQRSKVTNCWRGMSTACTYLWAEIKAHLRATFVHCCVVWIVIIKNAALFLKWLNNMFKTKCDKAQSNLTRL